MRRVAFDLFQTMGSLQGGNGEDEWIELFGVPELGKVEADWRRIEMSPGVGVLDEPGASSPDCRDDSLNIGWAHNG